MKSSILLLLCFGLVFQVKGEHDPQMNSWCSAFPRNPDCLEYQNSHTAPGKCTSLLAEQKKLTANWEKNHQKNKTADSNYKTAISDYKQYLKDWEKNFYELNTIININPFSQIRYTKALHQMKLNAQKIKIAYTIHIESIQEHHTIINQFKHLREAQIKVQEDLKKNNCN